MWIYWYFCLLFFRMGGGGGGGELKSLSLHFLYYSDKNTVCTLSKRNVDYVDIAKWDSCSCRIGKHTSNNQFPRTKKGHFDRNPANPKFDLYYSKRKIGIQLADFPKGTSFTRKTPEIHRVEDAKNARPPCWPWIQSSGQRFHAVTSSYQHDAASHSFLCKMSSSESDLSSSISSESSFLSIHDPLGDVENVDSSVGGSTTVFDDSFEGCCGRRTSSKL